MRNGIWIVEELVRGKWKPVPLTFHSSRAKAERSAKALDHNWGNGKHRAVEYRRATLNTSVVQPK